MTGQSDSTERGATLAKKVKCASFDISVYPKLEKLAAFAGKACAARLSTAINLNIPPANADVSMQNVQAALDDLPENLIGYWFGDRSSHNAMFISFSPSFVGGLSEALLGGPFNPSSEGADPTALDSELTQLFGLELGTELNAHLSGAADATGAGDLNFTREAKPLKKLLKDGLTSAVFKLEITLKLEAGDLKSAMTLYFPVEFLDERGLLTQISKSGVAPQQNTKWYADMLENVYLTEIELPVVIAKYKMTLSELSRLKVDQFIPLEDDSHNALDITLKTDEGVLTVCKGRLGTFKENKAAKVVSDVGVY